MATNLLKKQKSSTKVILGETFSLDILEGFPKKTSTSFAVVKILLRICEQIHYLPRLIFRLLLLFLQSVQVH